MRICEHCGEQVKTWVLSRLTLLTDGDNEKIEQITKHLNRLIEVVKVIDLTDGEHVERELLLVKIRAEDDFREEVKRTTDIFRGTIVDVGPSSYTVQLTGPTDKLIAYIDAIGKKAILEVIRSGVSGVGRSEKILEV